MRVPRVLGKVENFRPGLCVPCPEGGWANHMTGEYGDFLEEGQVPETNLTWLKGRNKRGRPSKEEHRDIPNPWGVTPHQAEVLRLLIDGKDQPLIAFCMGISIKTVAIHIHRLKDKMGAETTLHAAIIWDRFIRDGLKTI